MMMGFGGFGFLWMVLSFVIFVVVIGIVVAAVMAIYKVNRSPSTPAPEREVVYVKEQKSCASCGRPAAVDHKYCPYCGSQL